MSFLFVNNYLQDNYCCYINNIPYTSRFSDFFLRIKFLK